MTFIYLLSLVANNRWQQLSENTLSVVFFFLRTSLCDTVLDSGRFAKCNKSTVLLSFKGGELERLTGKGEVWVRYCAITHQHPGKIKKKPQKGACSGKNIHGVSL